MHTRFYLNTYNANILFGRDLMIFLYTLYFEFTYLYLLRAGYSNISSKDFEKFVLNIPANAFSHQCYLTSFLCCIFSNSLDRRYSLDTV